MVLRWCIVGVALFVAFLYYQPLSSYLQTRSALNERAAEVERLRDERARLQKRLADSETVTALAREARRMRLVRPGERIFIVKGVASGGARRLARRPAEGIGRTTLSPRAALLAQGGVLSRADSRGYRHSLRPCLETSIAPRRRASSANPPTIGGDG